MNDSETSAKLAALGIPLSNEELISPAPVIVRKRVAFGDCDPAGVVYTPRFADYLVMAHSWLKEIILPPLPFDLPMRGITIDFQSMLRVGDRFDMRCEIEEIRSRTFDIVIRATTLDGQPTFSGKLTPIAYDRARRSALPLPDEVRQRLLEYREACR